MNRTLTLLTLATALVASGCFGRARVSVRSTARVHAQATTPARVVVHAAPPAVEAQATAHGSAPSDGAVWVEGYYEWQASAWVWIDGHWETGHPGEVWVAPVADTQGDDVVYYPGYWCPEDETPPERYRSGGTVRVTVRGGATSGGSATAGGGSTVRVRGGSTGGTGTVRVGSNGGVNHADPSVATAAPRPTDERTYGDGGSGTVVAGGGSVRVRDPNAGSGSTMRPNPNTGGGSVSVRDPNAGSGSTMRPNPNTGGQTGGGSVTVRDPNAGSGSTIRPNPRREPLSCTLQTARAPEGGLVSLSGSFSTATRVMIGGQLAPVASRSATSMQVRVPGSSGGGAVTATDSGSTARCGTLSIASR